MKLEDYPPHYSSLNITEAHLKALSDVLEMAMGYPDRDGVGSMMSDAIGEDEELVIVHFHLLQPVHSEVEWEAILSEPVPTSHFDLIFDEMWEPIAVDFTENKLVLL
jgi:hypothetical protein